ncbi:hypothetical protein MMC20_005007, partial [Loxospora ochrophaea]|nr:hypothetical protein [Loxospora ochrophaea]
YNYLPLYEDFKETDPENEDTHPPVNVLLTDHTVCEVIDKTLNKLRNWLGDLTKNGDIESQQGYDEQDNEGYDEDYNDGYDYDEPDDDEGPQANFSEPKIDKPLSSKHTGS